jgi:hypothetical protein
MLATTINKQKQALDYLIRYILRGEEFRNQDRQLARGIDDWKN